MEGVPLVNLITITASLKQLARVSSLRRNIFLSLQFNLPEVYVHWCHFSGHFYLSAFKVETRSRAKDIKLSTSRTCTHL